MPKPTVYIRKNYYPEVKKKIKRIYNELINKNISDRSLFFVNLDINKRDKFKLLFLYSLLCTVLFWVQAEEAEAAASLGTPAAVAKAAAAQNKIKFPRCFEGGGFIFLYDRNLLEDGRVQRADIKTLFNILMEMTTYFNTDANNIIPDTGKILAYINSIEIKVID